MVRATMGASSSQCDVKIILDQHFYHTGSIPRGHVEVALTSEAHIGDTTAPGNYRFPFVFEVPRQGEPSTYHAKDGDVTYYIKAKALIGKAKREFRVISHLEELTESNLERSFHSSYLKHGHYGVEVVLNRTEYLSGEDIVICLNLIRGKKSRFYLSSFLTTELFEAVKCKEGKGFLTSKVCLARRRIFFPRDTPPRMSQTIPIPHDAMPATSFETAFEHPVELNYYLIVRLSSKEGQIPIKVRKKRMREIHDHVETWTTV